ncbi:MAG: TerB family tellurite resistance protein [Myxococcota bacterium]|jgi:hypothetical protein|nr:hypothetical protein [Deltaproteobacteria bacterium]MCP4241643.1 TerB family tellurite resistance protein [bacterium]MDP6075428.1 TerB family tellurite resistance protein [Myxococcota bacterium]MBT39659.1 hypothetical protein [Deltaproteobacteria bacterium]MDP6243712.1 TerB family tellurite resistance protein [Myxococcota bacterium]|tara:strand:- start:366 stop:707 length:342 start_codon:yes stop_codon:yes gene_type:complete
MTSASTLKDLDIEERMRLMRFVCSFAWVDLKITREERALCMHLISRLQLDRGEMRQVKKWLKSPPVPDSVDPTDVPRQHRVQFLRSVESMVAVDGEVTEGEREAVILFAQLIR